MKNNTDAMRVLAAAGWAFEEIRGVLSPPAITYFPNNAPVTTNPILVGNPTAKPPSWKYEDSQSQIGGGQTVDLHESRFSTSDEVGFFGIVDAVGLKAGMPAFKSAWESALREVPANAGT